MTATEEEVLAFVKEIGIIDEMDMGKALNCVLVAIANQQKVMTETLKLLDKLSEIVDEVAKKTHRNERALLDLTLPPWGSN